MSKVAVPAEREHAGPGAHLAVVGAEHQVAARPTQHLLDATRGRGAVCQRRLELVEPLHEALARIGERPDEEEVGPEIDVAEDSVARAA